MREGGAISPFRERVRTILYRWYTYVYQYTSISTAVQNLAPLRVNL
jgi:hypothetical protein